MILSRQLRAHTSTKHHPYSPKSLKCMGNTCCRRLSGPRKFVLRRTGPEELRRALGWQSCRRRDGDVRYSVNLPVFIFFSLSPPTLPLFLLLLNEPRLLGDSDNATVRNDSARRCISQLRKNFRYHMRSLQTARRGICGAMTIQGNAQEKT